MRVDLDSEAAWETIRAQIEARGAAMVPCPPDKNPRPFSEVEVTFCLKDKPFATGKGQVVHIGHDGHIALSFTGEHKDTLSKARPKAASKRAVRPTSPLKQDDDPELAAWKRYETLTKAEKIRLARYGNANERRIVLRDRDASLHLHVLNNPGVSGRELAALIKSGGVSGAFIRRITERADLMGNASVIDALVHHPQTPVQIALKLVARLPIQTARRIAKSGNLRTQIVAACRKRVIRK